MAEKLDTSMLELSYVKQTGFGVLPASPQLQELRLTGESKKATPNYTESEEMRKDRQVTDQIQTGLTADGDINIEFSYGTYDDLMEGAFFADFNTAVAISTATDIQAIDSGASGYSEYASTSTDFLTSHVTVGKWLRVSGFATAANNGYKHVRAVSTSTIVLYGVNLTNEAATPAIAMKNDGTLQNGVTKKFFAFEKNQTDQTVNPYQNFQDEMISGFKIEFADESVLKGSFSTMGATPSKKIASSIGTSTLAAPTEKIFNCVAHVKNFLKDNAAITFHNKEFSIELDNSGRFQTAIGVKGAVGIGAGKCVVKGSLNAYLDDVSQALYNDVVDDVPFSLATIIEDNDGNAYIFTIYEQKITDVDDSRGGADDDVMLKMSYGAFMENGPVGKTIQIDRIDK